MSRFKINSLFLHGVFEVKQAQIEKSKKDVQRISKTIGGNTLNIYFKSKSFSLMLSKNIRHYLLDSKVNGIVKKHIDDELKEGSGNGIDILKVSTRVSNVQFSKTFDNCSVAVFTKDILFPFCARFKIGKVRIEQEPSTGLNNIETSVFQTGIDQRTIALPTALVVARRRASQPEKCSVSIKFQVNVKKDQVHVSGIFTDYFEETRDLLDWLETCVYGA